MTTHSSALVEMAACVRADAAELTLDLVAEALAYLQSGIRPLARAALTHPAHLPAALAGELLELTQSADGLVARLEAAELALATLAPSEEPS